MYADLPSLSPPELVGKVVLSLCQLSRSHSGSLAAIVVTPATYPSGREVQAAHIQAYVQVLRTGVRALPQLPEAWTVSLQIDTPTLILHAQNLRHASSSCDRCFRSRSGVVHSPGDDVSDAALSGLLLPHRHCQHCGARATHRPHT